MLIINPGSHVEGGTEAQAVENAREWHARMLRHGITDVVMDEGAPSYSDGRWTFTFRHTLTGRTAELQMHGQTDEEVKALLFGARIYWNGSSSSDPEWKDFLAPGFEVAIRPKVYMDSPIVIEARAGWSPRGSCAETVEHDKFRSPEFRTGA